MREIGQEETCHLFEMGEGGNGAQVIVDVQENLPVHREGFGTVHHVAFRVDDKKAIEDWITHYQQFQLPNSGFVDRFFFQSLYARVTRGILIELATEGPGFMGDEPYETLGEKLSLPPFLENSRESIESQVRHFDTVRSTKTYEKE
ncbi:MAG: VOC family protein [Alkalibacterium thalassium]|nr:VOC family protein [Alkalibacterium thalassium]